jgi:hypothetical protein
VKLLANRLYAEDFVMLDLECRLYRFSLGYAGILIADLTEDQLTAQPPGLTLNHAAWILGHLCLGADYALKLLGYETLCPAQWLQKFGPGSALSNQKDDYPSKQALWQALEAGVIRVCEVAPLVDPERLARPHGVPVDFLRAYLQTSGEMAAHMMTTHQATHLGQLSAWRRALRLPGVLPI